ncbi:AAEL004537-PA, partial [Aedes aegypti]
VEFVGRFRSAIVIWKESVEVPVRWTDRSAIRRFCGRVRSERWSVPPLASRLATSSTPDHPEKILASYVVAQSAVHRRRPFHHPSIERPVSKNVEPARLSGWIWCQPSAFYWTRSSLRTMEW